MTDVKKLITEHLDIWLTAETEKKSGRGRSSGSSNSIYGVQRLRELIFDCAIRGLLTHQNKNDNADKIILEISQVIERKNNCKVVDYGSHFQDLPKNWCLTNLSNISYINPRNQVKDEDVDASFIPMTLIPQIYSGKHLSEKRKWKDIKKGFTHFKSNDIGIAKITPCFENSKACVFENLENDIGAGTTELHIVRPIKYLEPKYVLIYFKSPTFLSLGEQYMTGTAGQKRLPKEFVGFFPFPLPPLEEQQRIVAKVDELMQLCDQLEQQQNLSSEAHDQLVDTLLSVLINSSDVDDFQKNWQRISENFDLLFTTEYSIEQLKQTILQLAVMGRLVKQDPSDEPASELLEQIAEEKARLVKEGKIKNSKPLLEISNEEKPFELPDGWVYSRLLGFVDLKGGFAYKSELFIENSTNQVVRMGNVRPDLLRLEEKAVFITDSLATETVDSELVENDIIITMTGTRGKKDYLYTALVKADHLKDKKLFLNQRLTTIRVNEQLIDARYLNIVFKVDQVLQPLFDSATGTANQANVGMLALGNLLVPLCPINEQKSIVEMVNQLFTLIDKLQILQGKLQRTKLHLADSLVANALLGSNDNDEPETADNIVQFEKPTETIKPSNQKSTDQFDLFADESADDDLKLLSLAAEITFQLHTEPTFGHLKLQKLIYLCQQLKHMDLSANFKQHAAGPYDRNIATYIDTEFKKRQWFSYHQDETPKYKQLRKCGEHRADFDRFFAKEASELNLLLGLFRTSKSDHIEIVATLFACWLRLLEKKLSVTEEQLLKDFYAWSKEKKKFSKVQVLNGYKWMKQNLVVPL